jgi:hypothetical protein
MSPFVSVRFIRLPLVAAGSDFQRVEVNVLLRWRVCGLDVQCGWETESNSVAAVESFTTNLQTAVSNLYRQAKHNTLFSNFFFHVWGVRSVHHQGKIQIYKENSLFHSRLLCVCNFYIF